MAALTYTIAEYIEPKEGLFARIQAIELLIDKAILSMAGTIDGVGNNISEYRLDDGQVKIVTLYRSVAEVERGIRALELMKNRYVNRYNGRIFVCRDEKTFRR